MNLHAVCRNVTSQQTSIPVSCSNPLDCETRAAEFFQEDYSRIISGLPGNFATAGPSTHIYQRPFPAQWFDAHFFWLGLDISQIRKTKKKKLWQFFLLVSSLDWSLSEANLGGPVKAILANSPPDGRAAATFTNLNFSPQKHKTSCHWPVSWNILLFSH